MALEPINSIASIQAQSMQRTGSATVAPKTNTETTDGSPDNAVVPVVDKTTAAIEKPSESSNQNGGKYGQPNNQQDAAQQATQAAQERQQATQESIKKAVENINKKMYNSEAVFGIHEKTNRVTIKIVDKDTKEVIKELPPEKTLDMIAKAWEMAGLLVDEKR